MHWLPPPRHEPRALCLRYILPPFPPASADMLSGLPPSAFKCPGERLMRRFAPHPHHLMCPFVHAPAALTIPVHSNMAPPSQNKHKGAENRENEPVRSFFSLSPHPANDPLPFQVSVHWSPPQLHSQRNRQTNKVCSFFPSACPTDKPLLSSLSGVCVCAFPCPPNSVPCKMNTRHRYVCFPLCLPR